MGEFKDMKFRVQNEEHSKQIQEALFKLGYMWAIGGHRVINTSEPYLFTYANSDRIYYGFSHFQESQNTEYKLINGEIIKATEEEKEVDTIQLTYAEAWKALEEGKKVSYLGRNVELRDGLIVEGSHIFAFHDTARPFSMKKEPDYEILGLHDDWVEIEVFGVKTHQIKGTEVGYHIDSGGIIYPHLSQICMQNVRGRVKYKGEYTKAKIKVTVDKDGNVAYEHL